MKRFFLLAALIWAMGSGTALADRISLSMLSRYLNAIDTAAADFTQVNADGTISTGRLFLKRPGRMRFEYNAPDDTLVMAGGGSVAVFDGKSNSGPEQFPLKRTPLNLILARQVDLSRSGMVVSHTTDGPATVVVAQDPEFPEYGTIRLIFAPDPLELRQWIITDSSGAETVVILGALDKGVNLGARMFNIVQEAKARER